MVTMITILYGCQIWKEDGKIQKFFITCYTDFGRKSRNAYDLKELGNSLWKWGAYFVKRVFCTIFQIWLLYTGGTNCTHSCIILQRYIAAIWVLALQTYSSIKKCALHIFVNIDVLVTRHILPMGW